jgi:hypothetical protein
MIDNIDTAPYLSIGKAKELIETVSKVILEEQGIEYPKDTTVTQLMRRARDSLNLTPQKIPENAKGREIAKKILCNLAAISQGLAEQRNMFGDGHGKNGLFRSLPPRYAKLAAGTSAVALNFMVETYQKRKSADE